MGVSYVKFCPRCEATTAVDSALCPNCGHQFRTRFESPVSEKTIAMTVIPTTGHAQPSPVSPRVSASANRPRRRAHTYSLMIGAAALVTLGAVFAVMHGSQVRHSRRIVPAARAAFQPYDVVIEGDAQGGVVPVATRSPSDLRRWQETQSPQTNRADAAFSDSSAHVHLYSSKRIVLVPQGSTARVVLEKGGVRRVQILDGLCRGTAGFMSRDSAVRLAGLAPRMESNRTAAH